MSDRKIEKIMESLMNEEHSTTSFTSEVDSINVQTYGIEKWEKFRQKFGDRTPDDVDTETFTVEWDFELEARKSGIEGFSTHIQHVEGRVEVIFYEGDDEEEVREYMEFTTEDFEKMKLENEPEFSMRQQLFINGLEINFATNTITIEYF